MSVGEEGASALSSTLPEWRSLNRGQGTWSGTGCCRAAAPRVGEPSVTPAAPALPRAAYGAAVKAIVGSPAYRLSHSELPAMSRGEKVACGGRVWLSQPDMATQRLQ